MARRKAPPPSTLDLDDLPHALRRDVVVVEDFVPPWEMPPSWRANDPEGDGVVASYPGYAPLAERRFQMGCRARTVRAQAERHGRDLAHEAAAVRVRAEV